MRRPSAAHDLVDRARGPGAAEQHDVLLGAADRLVDEAPRVVAQAHRLEAGCRRLGVRVGVQRQHLVRMKSSMKLSERPDAV